MPRRIPPQRLQRFVALHIARPQPGVERRRDKGVIHTQKAVGSPQRRQRFAIYIIFEDDVQVFGAESVHITLERGEIAPVQQQTGEQIGGGVQRVQIQVGKAAAGQRPVAHPPQLVAVVRKEPAYRIAQRNHDADFPQLGLDAGGVGIGKIAGGGLAGGFNPVRFLEEIQIPLKAPMQIQVEILQFPGGGHKDVGVAAQTLRQPGAGALAPPDADESRGRRPPPGGSGRWGAARIRLLVWHNALVRRAAVSRPGASGP